MPSPDLLFAISNFNHKTFEDASTTSSRFFFTVTMTGYAGIVYHSLNRHLLHLPLQKAYIRVWIVDISARITLSQVFENESGSPTSRAKYVFPLPASASVCAFELEHADGRVLTGVTEETPEAAPIFGVHARESARLDQLFTISVGSIPARQKVTVKLTFVMNLLDEGSDHVCLRLPMAIAKRYGETPAAILTTDRRTRVQITVDAQTSDVIQDIRSPTHKIYPKRFRTRTGATDGQRMTVTWLSETFLDQDFVLEVHARGLNESRCFAEIHPKRADTIAMQLSFVPKFEMPRVASHEYIFVVDRTSSMSGAPMETTKRTLEMLFRLLPDADTTFNIFSFASKVDGMWERSVPLNEENMQYAILNTQAIRANDSGTGFAHALQLAVASRNRNRPTVIFVLTGGGGYVGAKPLQRKGMFARCRRAVTRVFKRLRPSSYSNSSKHLDPFEVVSAAVDSCRPNAPLRLFTLGIGERVASAVCERLARSGKGECMFAVQVEDIIEKCAMLLNAGRTCVIENIMVDWHGPGVPLAINFSPSNYHRSLPQLEPPPPIQQAPHSITSVFPGMHISIFAITAFRSIPPEVRVRAKVEGLAEVLELVVPVTAAKQPFEDEPPLLHTLAARELITHLAEGSAPLPRPVAPATSEQVQKAAIVRLGLGYKLVSPHTSFVAIESQRGGATPRERSRQQHYYVSPSSVTSDAAGDYALGIDVAVVQTALDNLSRVADAVSSFYQAALAQSCSSSSSSQSARPFLHDHSSTDTFSTLSSLEGSFTGSQWTYSLSSSPSEGTIQRIPTPVFGPTRNIRLPRRTPVSGACPPPIPKEVYELVMLQSSDGAYVPSPKLEALVGVEIPKNAANWRVDETIWAIAVVVAYLKRRLGSRPDLLHALLSKPLAYVGGKGRSLLGAPGFSKLVVTAGNYVG
ncbi:hypothetical protein CY34DRAFT_804766 [Suillus luteus UH-Slu-Lm8-n1]|uniref:VIT domain-containing protein n=1 Tax=Suillus luteus UH-Slu-Lm8-n1 TaxID=930992 RepID=A0A0D0B8A1_9AGAM|nr:hypothetical protein CY34DRAFT_804766 [Suillus luteus UH-Slu-Lm8-n1]